MEIILMITLLLILYNAILALGLNYHFLDLALKYIWMTCPFHFLLTVLDLCSSRFRWYAHNLIDL